MPILLLLLGLALQDDPKTPEKQARARAQEMREECAAALESVDGVGSVGLGGSGTDYRIVIAVRDTATQRHVRELVGDTYGGVRILLSVAEGPRPAPLPEAPLERPRALPPPEPAPERQNPWNAAAVDCDIIRDHLGLKPVTHPAGNGKSWVPCRVTKRTTLGPGGVTSFSYTDHRPDCPIRMGRVGEPAASDHFTAWVFRSGITQPVGGTMGIPSNDWAWGIQAAADMASTMPRIRDGSSATGPVWIGGYGWLYPYAPNQYRNYYHSSWYGYSYWRPYRYWGWYRPWRWCR